MDAWRPSRPYTPLVESGENNMIPIAGTKTMMPMLYWVTPIMKCVLAGASPLHIVHISCKIS